VKEANDTNDNSETVKELIYKENVLVEVEKRLVDDVVKERSSTSLLTKGDPFVVNRKVGMVDNSFEIGIDFRGDQIDVATVMVVKTNQKVMRSHTIVLEVTKFAMPNKFAREAIVKLLGLKLVLNTQMKSIVKPMSLRKQGLGLGDNMIAIAKESTEMEERVTRLVLEVTSDYKYIDKLSDKEFKITTFVEM
nr:carbamoyl-phosphate synthase B [Tanacetum cinerariifolium]GEZ94121.1 carbamoyl-phosphate synthase B [Tanacetum cinerariifolium]